MLHTLLIAAAISGSIAVIVGVLIFITKRESRRRNHQLRDDYRALLSAYNLNPDFTQSFTHRILGVDTSRQVFVFVQHDDALPSAIIELADISSCRLWKDGVQISRKSPQRGETVEEYIGAVGLSFMRKSGVVVNVPVYSEVLDGIEEKILLSKTADQWLQRVQSMLAGGAQQRRQLAM